MQVLFHISVATELIDNNFDVLWMTLLIEEGSHLTAALCLQGLSISLMLIYIKLPATACSMRVVLFLLFLYLILLVLMQRRLLSSYEIASEKENSGDVINTLLDNQSDHDAQCG